MRHQKRNKKEVSYLNYVSSTDVLDGDGNPTGEKNVVYSSPSKMKLYAQSSSGLVVVEALGTDVQYDKVAYVSKADRSKIDENSVFFIDRAVEYDGSNKPLFDYRVKKIASLVNEYVIGLVKVGYSQ